MSPPDRALFVPNGLDRRTGRPAWPPARAEDLEPLALAAASSLPPAPEERDPFRRLPYGIEADDLAATGWAVVVPEGQDPEVLRALEPLITHRRGEAGDLYRKVVVGRGEEVDGLFRDLLVSVHDVRPSELPYHVLIVASPEEISYGFQQVLSQDRAVGRLHLATAADYRAYAEKIVAAEERPRRDRPEIAWFAADNGDSATERTRHELVEPLAGAIAQRRFGWRRRELFGPQATKEALRHLLGEGTPHLLFTATHGLAPELGADDEEEVTGALVTSDWPGDGRGAEWGPRCWFAAKDLPAAPRSVAGGVAFLFACYSGGTPEWDHYWFHAGHKRPERQATRPHVSPLAQALLASRGGPGAVVAHLDRAWTCSFSWHRGGEVGAYRDTLLSLMDGQPVGHSLHCLWEVHKTSASKMLEAANRRAAGLPYDRELLVRYWLAANDAGNFVVLGDPAVRLPVF
jgi:hypothetical protein